MNNPHSYILPNGLKYVVINNTAIQSCSIVIYVKVGAVNETAKTAGMSHFLEHLIFKGTTKRPTSHNISVELDSLGASYNAYTTKEYTAYHAKISSAKLAELLDIYSDMLFNSVLNYTDIEQEKSVVIAELNKSIDDSQHYSIELFQGIVFSKTRLHNSVIGTKSTIQQYLHRDISSYKHKYYIPGNMTISISGNIPDNIHTLIKRYFTPHDKINSVNKPYKSVLYKDIVPSVLFKNIPRHINQNYICIGFPIFGVHDKRYPALLILKTILGGNMSSRLFNMLRVKHGLVYNISGDIELYRDLGMFIITAGIENGNYNKALTLIKREILLIKDKFVTADELYSAIEYINGQFIVDFEDSYSIAEYYGQQLMYDKRFNTYDMLLNNIKRVTMVDIYKLANDIFDISKMCITVVGNISTV